MRKDFGLALSLSVLCAGLTLSFASAANVTIAARLQAVYAARCDAIRTWNLDAYRRTFSPTFAAHWNDAPLTLDQLIGKLEEERTQGLIVQSCATTIDAVTQTGGEVRASIHEIFRGVSSPNETPVKIDGASSDTWVLQSDGSLLATSSITTWSDARAQRGTSVVITGGSAPDPDTVRGLSIVTLAGSGMSGAADGSARSATFIVPAALATDARGNVYVADAGAQRVRIVSPTGAVGTIAGSSPLQYDGLWGAPGLADGPGPSARFSVPFGIAARNGSLYVADTMNHCIRRISSSGNVTTFACGLQYPRGLAFDREGNLYVADSDQGIRKFAPSGAETPVYAPVEHPYGIVVLDAPFGLAISDDHGIMLQRNGIWTRISSDATPGVPIQGNRSIGKPYQLARIGTDAIVYTDPATGTIRYLDLDSIDAAVLAHVAEPLGIAVLPNDQILFTSAATRQVERLDGFDPHNVTDPLVDALPPKRAGAYRVLDVGNSFIWWDNTWEASLPNMIERDLPTKVDIVPVQMVAARLGPLISYVEATAPLFDAVILHVDDGALPNDALTAGPTAWKASVTSALRELRATLASQHVSLLVVVRPMPTYLGPSEYVWAKIRESVFAAPYPAQGIAWDEALGASGVHWLDLWSTYMADIRSVRQEQIYTADGHLTEHGRRISATAIAAALRPLLPSR